VIGQDGGRQELEDLNGETKREGCGGLRMKERSPPHSHTQRSLLGCFGIGT